MWRSHSHYCKYVQTIIFFRGQWYFRGVETCLTNIDSSMIDNTYTITIRIVEQGKQSIPIDCMYCISVFFFNQDTLKCTDCSMKLGYILKGFFLSYKVFTYCDKRSHLKTLYSYVIGILGNWCQIHMLRYYEKPRTCVE